MGVAPPVKRRPAPAAGHRQTFTDPAVGFTMRGMKERVTIRLYEQPTTCDRCDVQPYRTTEDVRDWNYETGDQIGLHERDGGFLMGLIEDVQPEIYEDHTGRYKLAVVWTQD